MASAHPDLKTFLGDGRRPKGTLSYDELHGFLFAILNGPDVIPPSEWMDQVFAEADPGFEDQAQAEAIMSELMALHNAIVAPLAAEPPGLPPGVAFRSPAIANFDDDAPLSSWARGFVDGYNWIEESWEGIDEEFGGILAVLSFFSSRTFATEAFHKRPEDLGELSETIRTLFAEAALEYQQAGRAMGESPAPYVRPTPKTGRNDACPCGSGRKFKKCCGAAPAAH